MTEVSFEQFFVTEVVQADADTCSRLSTEVGSTATPCQNRVVLAADATDASLRKGEMQAVLSTAELPRCVTAARKQHAVKYGGETHRRTQRRRSNYAHVDVTVRARESRLRAQGTPSAARW